MKKKQDLEPDTLRKAWESSSSEWIAWARTGDHDDFFWRFNLPNLLKILPCPKGLTLDIGCGEGRLARLLSRRGYRVLGCDSSASLVCAAAQQGDALPVVVGDAARLPLQDQTFFLVTACMVLQDLDDLESSIREVHRTLLPGGHFCFCVIHPVNSSGSFLPHEGGERFSLQAPYFKSRRYERRFAKDGLPLTLHGVHHPLERYTRALEFAGFAIEALREPRPDDAWTSENPNVARWRRVPNSLHVRAVRTEPE